MQAWTDAAREELERSAADMAAAAARSGADAAEVADDLRRHVQAELAAHAGVVTQDDVRRVVARLGVPADPEASPAAPVPAAVQPTPAPADAHGTRGTRVLSVTVAAIFGVALPLFTLILELLAGWCASVFFDPLPTAWHAALVGLVPLANALACVVLGRSVAYGTSPASRRELCAGEPCGARGERLMRLAVWLNALAIGVAGYYALAFLPLTPFALIGVLYFGLGLVPLAPLVALIVALALRRPLRIRCAACTGRTPPRVWAGVAAAAAALIALEVPRTLTLAGIHMSVSDAPATRSRGLALLRRFGDDDILLRACYGIRKPVTDLVGFLVNASTRPIASHEVQAVYYRVTGAPYNAVQPPDARGLRQGALINAEEFDFAQGGDAVAARVRGLTLVESRLDTDVDALHGTAYTEWILVFRNASAQQREARAQVALPPGGVVSRLTLWIDGEEREAAFGGRGKVKAAYQSVVQQRRDPVLVTTSGPDQVLVQCFPVPPNGGEMKVRLGITAPLVVESDRTALLRLPYVLEQNYGASTGLTHAVWLEATAPATPVGAAPGVTAESSPGLGHALRGALADAALASGFAVRVERPAGAGEAWSADARADDGLGVRQVVVPARAGPPGRIVAVVDGSKRMAPHLATVARALALCPEGTELAVVLAGDAPVEFLAPARLDGAARARLAALAEVRCRGGCDNVPALLKAWDLAAASPSGAIVWFHATQPVRLSDAEALKQRWERRPGHPPLYDFQFGAGPNEVAAALNGLACLRRVPNLGDPAADAARPFAQWGGTAVAYVATRTRSAGGAESAAASAGAAPGAGHVARLWAADEVQRLAATGAEADRERAVALAVRYQLVTPVTGAVVLETAQQFAQAGLTPVPSDSVPRVVPEPGALALMLVGAGVLAALRGRRVRTSARGSGPGLPSDSGLG